MTYDYQAVVFEDAASLFRIALHKNSELRFHDLFRLARESDAVTGAQSESYTCSDHLARKYLTQSGIVFDDEFWAWVRTNCKDTPPDELIINPERLDVLARICTLESLDDELYDFYEDLRDELGILE